MLDRMLRLVASLLFPLLFFASFPLPAAADDAAMARFHHEQATRFYARGQYDRALEEFFRVEELVPSPRTAYNIALCFLRLNREEDAYHFFAEYLEAEDDAPGAEERRGFAERTVGERLEARLARARIVSDPPGATIYVDDAARGSYGQAPRVLALSPGEHRIFLRLEGHRPMDSSVTLERGQLAELELRLAPIVGTLVLTSASPARVTVRGSDGEIVAEGDTPFESAIPVGSYNVTLTAEGFLAWQRWANIDAGGRIELAASLERASVGAALTITANVPGAVVEVDGEARGFAPLHLPDLEPGGHEIRLHAPGRIPGSIAASLEYGDHGFMTFMLDREPHGPSSMSWILGGAGLSSLAAGAIVGYFALERGDAYRDARRNFTPLVSTHALRDETAQLNLTADLLLGIGLTALIAGVILYFVTDDRGLHESSAVFSLGGQ